MGRTGWEYLTDLPVQTLDDGSPEDIVAAVLTRAYELGWRGPERPPAIDPRGLRVFWPTLTGTTPVLTSEGLLNYWSGRGHRWILLRAEQACLAMSGPLAARWQEFLAAYEAQCRADGVTPLPDWADWRVFVGGEQPVVDVDNLSEGLSDGQ
tara:strand:+ start:1996 stop:2451 length:456 start_codon:yes stop_codon:yes gene_type:complete